MLLLGYVKKCIMGGAWVAPLGKHLTLDFGSGHDLSVLGIEPSVGLCADSAEPAWDSLSPLCPSPLTHTLSLKLTNKGDCTIGKKSQVKTPLCLHL